MKKFFYNILLAAVWSGFCFYPNQTAASSNIVINEIAWMGTLASANYEWIELYNPTSNNVDLTNWTLVANDGSPNIQLTNSIPAGGYFLLERTSDESVPGITADQIYTGALSNSGEYLILKDDLGNIVDSLDQSSGWLAGDNTTKQTMERTATNTWTNSTFSGGTPKNQNNTASTPTTEPVIEEPTAPNSSNYQPTEIEEGQFRSGDILINEFVSDPQDNEEEWIELYNASNKIINLDGWTIIDGSGSKTYLTGTLGINEDNRYLVIYSPKGNLNNAGDSITLKFANEIIDQISYGNWNDGNISDNAPVAHDPLS